MHNYQAARVFYLMRFITSLAGSTIFTTYSIYYVTKLGLNPFELVLVGTTLELTVLIFEGVTGVIADTYSRKLSVIIGMFILGAGFTFEGSIIWLSELAHAVPVFIWVMLSQILFGLGWTFVSGADTAWIVDETSESSAGAVFLRAKRISLAGSLLGIGISVGLSMLAANLPYLAGGLMYFLLGFMLIRWMKETGFTRKPRSQHSSHFQEMASTWKSGAKVVARSPLLLTLVFITLFSGAASEGYDRLWEIYMIREVGFPDVGISMAVWFGLISAISTVMGLLVVSLAEKRFRMNNQRAVSIAMFMLTFLRIAGMIFLFFAPGFSWTLVSVLLIGVVVAVSEPIYTTWLNMNIESKNRATILSMISQSDAMGQTAGGPVVGWIGSRVSIRASMLAASVLLLPILGLFGRLVRRSKGISAAAPVAESDERCSRE